MKNIRSELTPGSMVAFGSRKQITSIKDRSLIVELLSVLEGRQGFDSTKPFRYVEVALRGVVYCGTVKQFRDAQAYAAKPVGGLPSFVRRQQVALDKAWQAAINALNDVQ